MKLLQRGHAQLQLIEPEAPLCHENIDDLWDFEQQAHLILYSTGFMVICSLPLFTRICVCACVSVDLSLGGQMIRLDSMSLVYTHPQ